MKSSEKSDIEGAVDVDEFMIGGFKPEAPGRTPGDKALVVLAIEKVITKKEKESIGRAYEKRINDGSAKSLQTIFDRHISKNSSINTDKWRAYLPLKKGWDITQKLSDEGEGMKMLHMHIANLKGWLTVSIINVPKKVTILLDEYYFSGNRRNSTTGIFDKLLKKAMLILPHPYAAIKLCEGNT